MTDMPTGLGATASCPNCGAQVQVTQVAGEEVRCPDCGQVLPAGPRPSMLDDVTTQQLVRAYGVNGYDAEVTTDGAGLRCGACRTTSPEPAWAVDDAQEASDPPAVVSALRCPACGAAGTLVAETG